MNKPSRIFILLQTDLADSKFAHSYVITLDDGTKVKLSLTKAVDMHTAMTAIMAAARVIENSLRKDAA